MRDDFDITDLAFRQYACCQLLYNLGLLLTIYRVNGDSDELVRVCEEEYEKTEEELKKIEKEMNKHD